MRRGHSLLEKLKFNKGQMKIEDCYNVGGT